MSECSGHDPDSPVHVVPVNDLILHVVDDNEDCPCGPTTEPIERSDGTYGWVVVHHSLDGREKHEPNATA